ncbi:DUF2474 domain-containing protein [Rhizobium halophytocola]|uniref:DUF2474 family protein n=1 Tax=Rhizobium halophytocola TaxID=735519 RepID=A0ABS4DT20_9HYPH|nr:DUF2474 domain-containing protein [Rhizobium halophytocola]MBP1848829.1 hypothetical protein [Rhizobium halophytocola]
MAGEVSGPQRSPARHWGLRLLWFVGLWAAGVLTVGAVAIAIRMAIGA